MAIDQTKAGRFPADLIEEYELHCRGTGGTGDFSNYYESDGAWATFDPTLRQTILFAHHDLATDASFIEFTPSSRVMCSVISQSRSRTASTKYCA